MREYIFKVTQNLKTEQFYCFVNGRRVSKAEYEELLEYCYRQGMACYKLQKNVTNDYYKCERVMKGY